MKLLLLGMLFQLLSGTAEALNAAAGAETTFFYQAYLLERQHVTDPRRRLIAPGCDTDLRGCSFAAFVDWISSTDARADNKNNKDRFDEIFNNADKEELVETSRKLREAGFRADYDQTRLYPKGGKSPSVTVAIRGIRGIATATKPTKYLEEKQKMIKALELLGEVRKADNMRYFIPKLEKALGVKMEPKPATTADGLKYTTYDIDETAKKNQGVEDLAQKIKTAADALRKADMDTEKDKPFVIHQRIIREAGKSLAALKGEKCPAS